MEQLKNNPVVKFAADRPRLSAWVVLSLGMVILLVIEARDVGLLPGQWVSLIVATVLVAGACVWIISWEDADEADQALTTGDMPKVEVKDDDGKSA
jgi:MFS superfamily sulfate permease-like transporter